MTARDKTRPFTTKSDKAMRDEVNAGSRAGAGGGLRAVRHAASHGARRDHEDLRARHPDALFSGHERPLWTTTLESQWHRYLCKPIDPSTIH